MKTSFPNSARPEGLPPEAERGATPNLSAEASNSSSLALAPARPTLTPAEISQIFLQMDDDLAASVKRIAEGLAALAPHCSPDQLVDGCRLLTGRVDKLSSLLIQIQVRIRLGQPL
jgi:hypothetical protein